MITPSEPALAEWPSWMPFVAVNGRMRFRSECAKKPPVLPPKWKCKKMNAKSWAFSAIPGPSSVKIGFGKEFSKSSSRLLAAYLNGVPPRGAAHPLCRG